MFTNLVESSSHAKEFKRRGSFFLFTTATYVVLFVVTGVISIYAYDARLETQNLEIVMMLPPQELAPEPAPVKPEGPQPTRDRNESNIARRETLMATVDTPERPPDNVSTTPNKNLPVPKSGVFAIGPDYDPPGGGGPAVSTGGGRQVLPPRQQVEIGEPPPAPEAPPKVPRVISRGVITGQAISLPQPAYPIIAKQARIQGVVSVQVLIDEEGRVVSATAVNGPAMLMGSAQKAALGARFHPTTLSGQPVKVSGVITYDFKLNH